MAPKQKLFADIGAVGKRGDEFRAQVQYHGQDHQKKYIWGPYRSDEASAQKDLARYQGRAVSRVSMSFNLKGPAAWRLLFQVKPDPKGFDLKKIKPRSPY